VPSVTGRCKGWQQRPWVLACHFTSATPCPSFSGWMPRNSILVSGTRYTGLSGTQPTYLLFKPLFVRLFALFAPTPAHHLKTLMCVRVPRCPSAQVVWTSWDCGAFTNLVAFATRHSSAAEALLPGVGLRIFDDVLNLTFPTGDSCPGRVQPTRFFYKLGLVSR
jgi:hypothetical protein